MKNQKLLDAIQDTELFLHLKFVESGGKLTKDEYEAVEKLKVLCEQCLKISDSMEEFDFMKRLITYKGL